LNSLTNPILATVSKQNLSIEPFVHIVRFEAYFDSTIAVNFVHCEVKNVLKRQLDRMNNNIIQITKTTTGIIMIIMWLVWRWQWWRRQQWLMLLLFIMIIMQGIYNYIPKTNHVPREYNVTTILWLQFWVPVMLYLYPLINVLCCCICTFWSTCTVPSRVVFSSSLMCFLGSLLWYFLNDFKIVIVVSVIIGYHFFFSILVCCISVLRSLYF